MIRYQKFYEKKNLDTQKKANEYRQHFKTRKIESNKIIDQIFTWKKLTHQDR